jgi:hypothetical protein
MSYVLPVVACLTGQSPASQIPDSQLGECREHHLPLPQVTNATAYHLGGAVRLREWAAGHEGWRLVDVKCFSNFKVASAQN